MIRGARMHMKPMDFGGILSTDSLTTRMHWQRQSLLELLDRASFSNIGFGPILPFALPSSFCLTSKNFNAICGWNCNKSDYLARRTSRIYLFGFAFARFIMAKMGGCNFLPPTQQMETYYGN